MNLHEFWIAGDLFTAAAPCYNVNDETFESGNYICLYFTKVNTELAAGEQLPIGSGVPSSVLEYTIGIHRVTRCGGYNIINKV